MTKNGCLFFIGMAIGIVAVIAALIVIFNDVADKVERMATGVTFDSNDAPEREPEAQNFTVVDLVDVPTRTPLPSPTETVTAAPQVTQETAVIPTPTATFEPTAEYSQRFLADCARGISLNRRVHPNCPSNAAEMLGSGR